MKDNQNNQDNQDNLIKTKLRKLGLCVGDLVKLPGNNQTAVVVGWDKVSDHGKTILVRCEDKNTYCRAPNHNDCVFSGYKDTPNGYIDCLFNGINSNHLYSKEENKDFYIQNSLNRIGFYLGQRVKATSLESKPTSYIGTIIGCTNNNPVVRIDKTATLSSGVDSCDREKDVNIASKYCNQDNSMDFAWGIDLIKIFKDDKTEEAIPFIDPILKEERIISEKLSKLGFSIGEEVELKVVSRPDLKRMKAVISGYLYNCNIPKVKITSKLDSDQKQYMDQFSLDKDGSLPWKTYSILTQQMINDELIVNGLAKLGFAVGDKVKAHYPDCDAVVSGFHYKSGDIILKVDSSKIPDHTDCNEYTHSSFKVVDKGYHNHKWYYRTGEKYPSIEKDVSGTKENDQKISDALNKIGFFPGQRVDCKSPSINGIIVGYDFSLGHPIVSLANCDVSSIKDGTAGIPHKNNEDIHSSYSDILGSKNYKWAISSVKPSNIDSFLEKEAIKEGFFIGQRILCESSDNKMLIAGTIIGFKNSGPIVIFDPDLLKEEEKLYLSKFEENYDRNFVHSKYLKDSGIIYSCSKGKCFSNLDLKIIDRDNDRKIFASLKKIGFSIGQRIKCRSDLDNSDIISGSIIGIEDNFPIIKLDIDKIEKENYDYISRYRDNFSINNVHSTCINNISSIVDAKPNTFKWQADRVFSEEVAKEMDEAKLKNKDLDKDIGDRLQKIGLAIGDIVEVGSYSDGMATGLPIERTSYTIMGVVAGIMNGQDIPLIKFKDQGYSGSKLHHLDGRIHSGYEPILTEGVYSVGTHFRKVSSQDLEIEETLSKFDLKVGEQIEFAANEDGRPNVCCDFIGCKPTVIATVVGIAGKKPILAFKNQGAPFVSADKIHSSQLKYIENLQNQNVLIFDSFYKFRKLDKTIPNFLQFGLKLDDIVEVEGKTGYVCGFNSNLFPKIKFKDQASVLYTHNLFTSINGVAVKSSQKNPLQQELSFKQPTFTKSEVEPFTFKVADLPFFVESKYKDNENKTFLKSKLKSELTSAGYRVVANQAITISKNVIVSALKSQGQSNEYIDSISTILDTEFGRALIALSFGIGISYFSSSENNPKLTRFAKECRVNSMSILGNSIIKSVVDSAIEAIKNEPIELSDSEYTLEDYDVEEEYPNESLDNLRYLN